MKVLLMGDASNYHWALANGLRSAGHEVTVASHGSRWMNTSRDIDISRKPGKLGGLELYARFMTTLRPRLAGYDVVQLCGPSFVELRPGRIRKVFDMLRENNGRVFLTAIGTDSYFVERCVSPNPPLAYSEWQVKGCPTPYSASADDKKKEWLTPEMRQHCRMIYDNVDGAVSVLYEYHKVLTDYFQKERLAYAGIPVEIENVQCLAMPPVGTGSPVRILVAYHKGRTLEKGTDFLLKAVREVERRNPGRVIVDEVSNIPYDAFLRRLGDSHIVVDQLYSYTPATTALLAMARGRVTVSGGEEDYYKFIGERELRPIINADPRDFNLTVSRIEEVALNPARLKSLGMEGRKFVEKHNAAAVVAERYIDFWDRIG